ncbi:hypothetical protein niasHT_024722 [Heterodera trifolii]|uniref:Uncharacterized protein n=1 Tax=Heterodera trifolii TaxID=157864 RepID=A0ABD2K111_9BILA
MPWHLFVSQECKEEAQVVCTECGWANCVPSEKDNEPDDVTCCPHVRKEPGLISNAESVTTTGENTKCCPTNYVFKCCTLLSEQKYTWRGEHMAVFEYQKNIMSNPSDEDMPYFHPGQGEYQCFCDVMAQFMLFKYTKEDEECKLETIRRIVETDEPYNLACFFKEGEKASKCCDENYALSTVKYLFWKIATPMLRVDYALSVCIFIGAQAEGIHWKLIHKGNQKLFDVSFDALEKLDVPSADPLHKLWVLSPIPNFAIKPPSYVFHHWLRKKTEDMVAELEKKSNNECKGKPIYCACDPLHFDHIMTGMCCDKTTSCECCSKIFLDKATKTRKKLARDDLIQEVECTDEKMAFRRKVPIQQHKNVKRCNHYIAAKLSVFCLWAEGSPGSGCCGKDYQIVDVDERYAIYNISVTSDAAIEGISRRHPFCRNRLPWIHPTVCAHECYHDNNYVNNDHYTDDDNHHHYQHDYHHDHHRSAASLQTSNKLSGKK